ncbi:MAG: hypothetical protein CMJ58_04170 [Planctomycetaceae bacterium]|nr:hypothetical protein [Planctomycetaceae bacterium]
MSRSSFPSTRLLAALVALVALLGSVAGPAPADNLTNLLDSDLSLLSQGTPFDVLNNFEFDYGENGRALRDNIDAANGVTGGWTMNATFTPTAADLAAGETRLIMEIGGTSNGTGLWLIDGVATLALKTGGGADVPPSSLIANDLDITDNTAAIYSSFGKLTAGNEVTFAATWDANDTFTVALQDNTAQVGVIQTARVTGTDNNYNWYGNSTFLEGDLAGSIGSYGGLNEATGNPFSADNAANFAGFFDGNDTLFWNAPATLALSDPAKPVLTVNINRADGSVTIANPTASAVTVDGYALIGGRGGFDDGGGPQKTVSAANAGGLFTIAAGGSENLGNLWVKSPFSDAAAQIDTSTGDSINALVTYSGPEYVFGDYDLSGTVDAGDWPTVLAGLVTDVTAAEGIGRYLAGDLTGNGFVGRGDFRLFKQLLSPADRVALFGVPEPTTIALFAMAVGAVCCQRRRRCGIALLALLVAATTVRPLPAADIYFVDNAGEIRSFTGITTGANPMDGKAFGGGTLMGTVAAYGSYQGFTHVPDGRVFGVNSTGGVDRWDSLSDWLSNAASTSLSVGVFGPEVTTSPRTGIHGLSFDGASGGFYVMYEGPDELEGDLGLYASLGNFVNNANAAVTPSIFNGNLMNFYYPDEDAPASSIPPNPGAAPGSNYFQITGGGQLEGWLDLFTPGFGYVAGGGEGGGDGTGGNRSYQLPGFGNTVVAGFADLSSVVFADLTLRVDTRTGMVSLKRGQSARDIDYIEITSAGDGLLASGYTGLGGSGSFPAGNGGTTVGWDLAPSNDGDTFRKVEAFALGSSEIAPGAGEIPLGTFYDTTKDTQDLTFAFDLAADGSTVTVSGLYIEYYESSGPVADVNGDNRVDGLDFLQLQRTNAGLIATWQGEYGAGTAVAAAGAVPEPSAVALILSAVLALGAAGRRR